MKKLLIAVLPLTFAVGCATNPAAMMDANKKATGALIGAIAGGVLGGQLDDDGNRDKGTIIGALTGAAAGMGVGAMMDKQEQAFKSALLQEQQQNAIEIQRLQEDTVRLTLNEKVSFDVNSSNVKPDFHVSLDKLASVLASHAGSRVTVVGFTDSTGSDSHNMALSQRRAASVGQYLQAKGINPARLSTKGMGESQPRATNATAQGRSQNRRVELIVQQPKPAS